MSVAPGWHDAGAAGNYQTASLLAAADAVREVVGRGPPFTETTSKLRGARILRTVTCLNTLDMQVVGYGERCGYA